MKKIYLTQNFKIVLKVPYVQLIYKNKKKMYVYI